jgi:hypothetical protein
MPLKNGLSSTRNVIKEARQDSLQMSKIGGKSVFKNLKSRWGRSNGSNMMEQSKIYVGGST